MGVYTPEIPVLSRSRKEGQKFKVTPGFIENLRPVGSL